MKKRDKKNLKKIYESVEKTKYYTDKFNEIWAESHSPERLKQEAELNRKLNRYVRKHGVDLNFGQSRSSDRFKEDPNVDKKLKKKHIKSSKRICVNLKNKRRKKNAESMNSAGCQYLPESNAGSIRTSKRSHKKSNLTGFDFLLDYYNHNRLVVWMQLVYQHLQNIVLVHYMHLRL